MLPLRQGIRFDPDLPQTLRLEFAKTNTKVVKPKQQLAQLAVAAAAAAAAGHAQYVQPIAGRKHTELSLSSSIHHHHHCPHEHYQTCNSEGSVLMLVSWLVVWCSTHFQARMIVHKE